MNLRFYNARILTMEEEKGKDCDLREIFLGEVHVKDSKISYVGEKPNPTEKFDREIDCKGNV